MPYGESYCSGKMNGTRAGWYVRLFGHPTLPPVIYRERGPRSFDEIPPSEVQLVARQLLADHNGETSSGSEPHLKALLDAFDLKRLTTNVGLTLLDILERQYPYVDDALDRSENMQ